MPRPDNVGVGIAVIVEHALDNRILLLKRQGAHASGTWACPGGWIDVEDESPKVTCVRELKEEIGIDVFEEELQLLDVVSEWHEDLDMRTVTVYYLAVYNPTERGEPNIMEPRKCSKVSWVYPKFAILAATVFQEECTLFPQLEPVLRKFIRVS